MKELGLSFILLSPVFTHIPGRGDLDLLCWAVSLCCWSGDSVHQVHCYCSLMFSCKIIVLPSFWEAANGRRDATLSQTKMKRISRTKMWHFSCLLFLSINELQHD